MNKDINILIHYFLSTFNLLLDGLRVNEKKKSKYQL